MSVKVTVWNEFRHEKDPNHPCGRVYPKGIHGCIADFLNQNDGIEARTATLDEPEHGLTDEVLEDTDVLTWWGHMAHHEVSDAVVDKIQQRVLNGMGLILLHSAHFSKIFRRMMGTSCGLRWRELADEHERVWCVDPCHPVAEGLGECFVVPHTERYGEHFDIPDPDATVFISWYKGGEVFRSGCCWHRGKGKIFYFSPGHETFPIYK